MDKLIKLYDNKYVRSLIQIIPFGAGSAIDVFVKETIENIRTERVTTFFNQLSKGEIELTEGLIKSEDFLHNYFSTIRIVLNTRRLEKIVLIGKLFNTSVNQEIVYSQDSSFESNLKILDELTWKEIEILFTLKDLEKKTNPTSKYKTDRLRANKEIWEEFKNLTLERFGINNDLLDETLIRIERTGCIFLPRLSSENDYTSSGAFTTETFSELLNLIKE